MHYTLFPLNFALHDRLISDIGIEVVIYAACCIAYTGSGKNQ